MNFRTCLLGSMLAAASAARAFPPAPPFALHGIVRDQVGQVIMAEGAQVILLRDGREVARTPIESHLRLDQNYELLVRIDQNRPGTEPYSDRALAPQQVYSLAVDLQGARYYPIEVAGTLRVGKAGERVRLDLNLGEDLDHDGLPDVWEQWQLFQAGRSPNDAGLWPIGLIDRDGDFDGDGLSNWREYVAGTFAGDATENFALAIKETAEHHVQLEFYGITGKTYTIERSTDTRTWNPVPFSLTPGGAASSSHLAASVGVLSAYAAPQPGGQREYYRLTVR